jgi:multiple sugar transport system substrate-binding protein
VLDEARPRVTSLLRWRRLRHPAFLQERERLLGRIHSEKWQADWAGRSRIVLITYDDPKIAEMDTQTNGYFTMLKDEGYLFGGAPPFPFHNTVHTALQPIFWQSLTGELTPEAALDQMCVTAETELEKLGYE